jgi:hypothetical protein
VHLITPSILSNTVTLDGFEAPNREPDEEFNEYAKNLLGNVDAILFGRRVAYQQMADYWPSPANNPSTSKTDLEITDKMNNLRKIVHPAKMQPMKTCWR